MEQIDKSVTAIEVHDLTVAYNKRPAIWNIDFELPQGKIIGIMGPKARCLKL